MSFDYGIPQKSQCTACHAILPGKESGETLSIFKPISPKARFLNNDYPYASGTENQLTHWENAGILTDVPADKGTIITAATFTDSVDPTTLSPSELDLNACSYLDINWAHCHRSELSLEEGAYGGAAGGSGLHLEFNRDFDADTAKFGVCKGAVAGGHLDYPYDVIPGYPEASYLFFRMSTLINRHKMPELGRSTVHTEGVALIEQWIGNMPANNCGVQGL